MHSSYHPSRIVLIKSRQILDEPVFLNIMSAIAQADLKKSVSCTKASCVHFFTFGLVVVAIIF